MRNSDNMLKRLKSDIVVFADAFLCEFRSFFRDKAVLSAFLGVAVLIFALYTYLYSHQVLPELPIAVIDLDQTASSRSLLRMFDSSEEVYLAESVQDLLQAKELFLQERVRGIVVIPQNFSSDLQKGRTVHLPAYVDPSYMLYYKRVLTAVKAVIGYYNAGVQILKKTAQGTGEDEALVDVQPVSAESVDLYNLSAGYGTFLMPVVLIIIFQTTLLNGIGILGGTMVEKRRFEVLYRQMQRPFGTVPVLLGKASLYLLLSLVVLAISVGIVMPCFRIPVRADFLSLAAFMVPFLLAVVFLAFFLINFFKHREAAILVIMFISIPVLMLTGFSWPDQSLPPLMNALRYLFPSTLGAKGFVALSQMGADFAVVKDYWGLLWGLALFYFILAALTFKRMSLAKTVS